MGQSSLRPSARRIEGHRPVHRSARHDRQGAWARLHWPTRSGDVRSRRPRGRDRPASRQPESHRRVRTGRVLGCRSRARYGLGSHPAHGDKTVNRGRLVIMLRSAKPDDIPFVQKVLNAPDNLDKLAAYTDAQLAAALGDATQGLWIWESGGTPAAFLWVTGVDELGRGPKIEEFGASSRAEGSAHGSFRQHCQSCGRSACTRASGSPSRPTTRRRSGSTNGWASGRPTCVPQSGIGAQDPLPMR